MSHSGYSLDEVRAAKIRAVVLVGAQQVEFEYRPREDAVYRDPLLILPRVDPGQPYPRVELEKVPLEEAPQDGWSVPDESRQYWNPGQTKIRATDGRVWRTRGRPDVGERGLVLPESLEILPWEQIEQVVRYLKPSEMPYAGSADYVVLTRYGIEVRTPVSVAVYPRIANLPAYLPSRLRSEAARRIEAGHTDSGWLFPD